MNYYDSIVEKGYYIISEIGVNYYDIARKMNISNMEAAKLMIKEAASAGSDAVKFQTYKADKIASKYSPSYWDTSEESTTSQYELFTKFDHFGEEEYAELSRYCKELNVEFMSTPFDFDAADYLNSMMDIYKISSSDLSNLPFIEFIARKNKPVILSVGASNEDEITEAVEIIAKNNHHKITLLHCVLEYPTPLEDANLNKIVSLKNRYTDEIIGYSDHTKPLESCDVIKTAFNLGAVVIEKHFTLDKTLPGNDHYHAMDPDDLRNIIKCLEFTKKIRGSYELKCLETETVARQNARRSIVAVRDIMAGEIISEDMITFKRPGHGISPAKVFMIIGKKATCDIAEDTVFTYSMFSISENNSNYQTDKQNVFKSTVDSSNTVEDHISVSYKCNIKQTVLSKYSNIAHHAQISNSFIGDRTSIGRYSKIQRAKIGKFCSVAWDVTIGALAHNYNRASSHAFTYRKQFGITENDIDFPQKTTTIGNDVWIGCNSVIVAGVTVGDGAVIGAGAVVTKDVEPYSIVVGVPAKHIKYRFDEKIRSKLEIIKWWNFDDQVIIDNIDLFTNNLDYTSIDKLELLANNIKKKNL